MLLERISNLENVSLEKKINRISQLKQRYRCLGSFPSDYIPIPLNETFAIINTRPNRKRAEHSIMIANSRIQFYFADSLGRPSFLKQQYKQMIPQPLQSRPSVCGFCTIYAIFHLFKIRQEKILKFTRLMYFHS